MQPTDQNAEAGSPQTPASARLDSLIEYPCRFPIKVMGEKTETFVQYITAIALKFDPHFNAATLEVRESAKGNYLGVTLIINAVNREQLDDIYLSLTRHPLVKVVL